MTLVDFDVDTEAFQGFKSHWSAETLVFTKQTTGIDQTSKSDDMDISTMGTRFKNSLPGMQDASSKFDAVHTDKIGYLGDVIRRWVGGSTPRRVWSAFESLNALAPVTFQPCLFNEYSVKSTEKDAVKATVGLKAKGAFNSGHILVSPKGNTQLLTTGVGADCDESTGPLPAGPSTYGGVIQMHFYDLVGGTTPSVTVIVEHSANGSTWTTLGSFVAVTSVTILTLTVAVQRVKIPSTTTVLAHTHASWTTTGSPTSAQAIVMVGRGIDPDA